MSTKFVRFIAALVIIASVIGNSGVGRADRGAPPSVSAQNREALRTSELKPLTISAASSPGIQFVHVATAANILSDATVIDYPLTNGNQDAIILVTPNYTPGGVSAQYNNHPIGVEYDGSKWWIFNQDGAAMPVGAAFNVIVPTSGAFVHTSTAAGNDTVINNALTNGHPNAIVFVTLNLNPGGVCGCIGNNHNTGVFYSAGKWIIYNQDHTNVMEVGAAFNVFVLTAGAGIFVHTTTTANINGSSTEIDNALTNGHPNAIVFVTPNWNPGGVGGTDNNHPIGVYYNSVSNKWAIFNQDGAAPAGDAAFNVLVLFSPPDIFVHVATFGGTPAPYTFIGFDLANGNPNAIIFVTPNFNPGGAGGTGHNHNIGMFHNTGGWVILNEDYVTMTVNAAFNVLVPNPDTSVFVHKATAANILSHSTIIDYPLTNGKPNAIMLVTPNDNPGGVGGIDDNHPIGVFYDGSKWRIFNQDGAAMPVGAAFNVFVPTAGPGVGVFVTKFTGPSWPVVTIDNPLANGNPNAIILVTPNYNPGGVGGVNADFPIGVRYYSTAKKWGIFSQDGTNLTDTTAFNVYVFANRKAYLPLVRR